MWANWFIGMVMLITGYPILAGISLGMASVMCAVELADVLAELTDE